MKDEHEHYAENQQIYLAYHAPPDKQNTENGKGGYEHTVDFVDEFPKCGYIAVDFGRHTTACTEVVAEIGEIDIRRKNTITSGNTKIADSEKDDLPPECRAIYF